MYPEYEMKQKKSVNKSAVVRIVIWSVVLAILVGAFVCAMIFEGDNVMFGIHINVSGYKYDDADSYRVGGGESTDTITALDINWIDGSVDIVAVDGDKITISETYDGEDEDKRLRWKVENGKLTVKYCKSGRLTATKKSLNKQLTVEVPRAMLESMSTVDVELVSADLNLRGVKANEMDVESVSGKIMIEGTITELGIETVSGDLDLVGYIERANIEGVSATLKTTLLNDWATLDIETVSGNIEVYLPESTTTGFEAIMDAVSGSIQVEGFDDLTQKKSYCRYGDGGIRMNVDAVSGNLKIRKIPTE